MVTLASFSYVRTALRRRIDKAFACWSGIRIRTVGVSCSDGPAIRRPKVIDADHGDTEFQNTSLKNSCGGCDQLNLGSFDCWSLLIIIPPYSYVTC